MKLRVKYSNTQKFTIQIEELTFRNLKATVTNYISSTYDKHIEKICLSFNGKDPICADDPAPLSSLGIVSGDLLIVIQPSNMESQKAAEITPRASAASCSPKKMTPQNQSSSNENICGSNISVSTLLEAKDGVPPPSVVEHLERYSPSSSGEALNILIHITMIEAGFVLGDSPSNSVERLPLCWKEMAATFKYHNAGFQNFVCSIVMVTMGNVKQVLASFSGQESEISVRLDMKEFIASNQLLPHRLMKLSQLARTLRNDLLYPLQVAAHLTLGLPAPWHLAGLPQEILIKISSMLSLRSVLNLSSTCKRLQTSSIDTKLWYNLFKRDFADQFHSSDTIAGADWRAKYRSAHERRRQKRQSDDDKRHVLLEDPDAGRVFPPRPNPDNSFNPFMPQPRGPHPYHPPHPDPQPNPYWDPDSPYFGGEIPPPRHPFLHPDPLNPLNPFGGGARPRPSPFAPPFMPPLHPSGPRFRFL